MKNFLSLLVAALALNIAISSLALPNLVSTETVYAAPTGGQTNYVEDMQAVKDAEITEKQKEAEAKTAEEKSKNATQESSKTPLKDLQFDVSKNLKLKPDSTGKEQQPQSYFKNNYPPIIAFILTILDFATQIIGSLAVLIMIIGGFMFMTAQGDQTQIDKAKDVIKYAIIGLVVTFLSYIIVIFLQSLFITSEQVPTG